MSNRGPAGARLLAERFKALSNPHRLSVFMTLAACCPGARGGCRSESARKCVGDLGKRLSIAPSTVSHHMKELCRAGLIRMARRGRSIECWVEPGMLETLGKFFLRECRG